MSLATQIRPTADADANVVFDEIAPGQWRILDSRFDEGAIDALLGFACDVAGLIEVTSMKQPSRSSYCTDLDAVRSEFVDLELFSPAGVGIGRDLSADAAVLLEA